MISPPDPNGDPAVDEEARSARRWALTALARQGRSRHELRIRLERKGFPLAAIEEALAGLVEAGWLDDARFAGEFAQARARRGFGRARVRADLAARGVADEVAADALRRHYPAGEEADRALAVAAKKAGGLGKAGRERQAAIARHLLGRGFSPEAIARALRETEKEKGA